MRKKKKEERVDLQPKTLYAHTCVYNVFGDKLDDLLTTHKILNKRWIKGLVYRTRSSVIFTGRGLLGWRSMCI